MLTNRATKDLLHPRDGVIKVQFARLHDLSSRKGEKLVGELAGALCRNLDLVDVLNGAIPFLVQRQ